MKIYYVYSLDQYGYQNHGSHYFIEDATHHITILKERGINAYIANKSGMEIHPIQS